MVNQSSDWKKPPPPLKKMPKCSGTKCEAGFHSFKTNMRKKSLKLNKKTYRNGNCSCCDADLVNWKRIDADKDLKDVEYLFTKLKLEEFRNVYWKARIDEYSLYKARKKGLLLLRQHAENRIKNALGHPSNKLYRDGTQTPLSGDVVYYAQHATATCCRKCVEEWHNIKRNHNLTKKEIKHLADLIMIYIKKKLPNLTNEGENI